MTTPAAPAAPTPPRTRDDILAEQEARRRRRHVLGLDLGKQQDHSALALLEYQAAGPAVIDGVMGPVALRRTPPVFSIRTAHRWPLGTGYRSVVASLVRTAQSGQLPNVSLLAIDVSGPGEAVWEDILFELRQYNAPFSLVGVTITPGTGFRQREGEPGRWNVSKFSLASELTALLARRRLVYAPGLPGARDLMQELEAFSTKITATAQETFEAARGSHDDLCMAVALAAWAAVRQDHPADAVRMT